MSAVLLLNVQFVSVGLLFIVSHPAASFRSVVCECAVCDNWIVEQVIHPATKDVCSVIRKRTVCYRVTAVPCENSAATVAATTVVRERAVAP